MKKHSPVVKQWRGRKRAAGLRPLSLWLDTSTYSRLQTMAQREQTSPTAIVTQALRRLESGSEGVKTFPFR
jgi:hypothetical protein